MNRQVLRTELVDAIRAIQEISGDPLPDDFGEENVEHCMGDIAHFDSMRGAEVTTRLSKEVDCEIEDLISLFDTRSYEEVDHFEEITITKVVNHLDQLVANS